MSRFFRNPKYRFCRDEAQIFTIIMRGAQWPSGRVLYSRQRGCTLSSPQYWFNQGRPGDPDMTEKSGDSDVKNQIKQTKKQGSHNEISSFIDKF